MKLKDLNNGDKFIFDPPRSAVLGRPGVGVYVKWGIVRTWTIPPVKYRELDRVAAVRLATGEPIELPEDTDVIQVLL